ncbi:MAG: hypothetical protein ACR2PL_17000, partial [Dehalococcoidia bacterium]
TYLYYAGDGNILHLKPVQSAALQTSFTRPYFVTPFFDYAGDDPTYKLCRDSAAVTSSYVRDDGSIDLFAHCEYRPLRADFTRAYWSIVLFRQVGSLVTPVAPVVTSFDAYNPDASISYGAGLPSVVKIGDYYYLYFIDYHYSQSPAGDAALQQTSGVVVARALVRDASNPSAWKKYYQGNWDQPANSANPFLAGGSGKAGLASSILDGGYPSGPFSSSQATVSYNSYAGQYMALVGGGQATTQGVYASFSVDGLTWTAPSLVFQLPDAYTGYAVAIDPASGDTHSLGRSFLIVYSSRCCGLASYRSARLYPSGDVNGDGTSDAVDALCILRSVAGLAATQNCLTLSAAASSAVSIARSRISAQRLPGLAPIALCPVG